MKKFTISFRNILYHAEFTSFLNNLLRHSDTHYIMQKLTILSFRRSLYDAETTSLYMLKHVSQYILHNLYLSAC